MVGKTVLYAWDDKDAHAGWYMGHVQRRGAPAKDEKKTPSANFVVKYTEKLTGGKLEGTVSCELSANLYGAEKWWVLLKRNAPASALTQAHRSLDPSIG